MAAILQVKNLQKSFGQERVLKDISFEVKKNTVTALAGKSGSGKTTVLKIIAGFLKPDTGEVWLNGKKIADCKTGLEVQKRKIAVVFQNLALFPHLTVEQNVLFGFSSKSGYSTSQVDELIEICGIDNHRKKYPHQLSGGQQQRVALCRAMATFPEVLIMDEPFSNLDPGLTKILRNDLKRIFKRREMTVLLVSHSIKDLFSLADQVVMLTHGEVAQIAAPEEVYKYPKTLEIADFGGISVPVDDYLRAVLHNPAGMGELVTRPENLQVAKADDPTGFMCTSSVFDGSYYLTEFTYLQKNYMGSSREKIESGTFVSVSFNQ